METSNKYKTPQYLNEPYRLIIFTLDEVFVAVGFMYIVAFVCGFVLTSLFLMPIIIYLMKKMKGNEGPHFYSHLFYWFFSMSPTLRATPPSWIREFLG